MSQKWTFHRCHVESQQIRSICVYCLCIHIYLTPTVSLPSALQRPPEEALVFALLNVQQNSVVSPDLNWDKLLRRSVKVSSFCLSDSFQSKPKTLCHLTHLFGAAQVLLLLECCVFEEKLLFYCLCPASSSLLLETVFNKVANWVKQ